MKDKIILELGSTGYYTCGAKKRKIKVETKETNVGREKTELIRANFLSRHDVSIKMK